MMVHGLSVFWLGYCCVASDDADVMVYLEVLAEATLEEPYHRYGQTKSEQCIATRSCFGAILIVEGLVIKSGDAVAISTSEFR